MLEIALPDRTRMIQKPTLKHRAHSLNQERLYLRNSEFYSQINPQGSIFLGKYSMSALDSVDVSILAVLQKDASRSIAEIAERVHLSQNACWRRIKRLEDEGLIKKRVALLDPEKLGVGVTVFVSVRAGEH